MKKLIEIRTPQLPDIETCMETIVEMKDFDSVILEEAGGVSAIEMGVVLGQYCTKEIFLKITCRDRNRIALHSEMTTAAIAGLFKVIIADGTHPAHTQFPAAKPVYELDALNLMRMIKSNNPPFGVADLSPLSSQPWNIGVCIGGLTHADTGRARKFASAGADLFFVGSLAALIEIKQLTDKPIFLSVAAEQTQDFSETLREAEEAGANGVNLVVGSNKRLPL
jgi:5,10-methylenetetrahydrofolate reductase